jgi:hypothetical protein
VRVDIDGPEGTLVALVCAETLAVCAVPRADGVILRDGEDEVALLGEPVREVLVGVVQSGRWRRRRRAHVDFSRRAHTYLTWVRARSWPESNMGLMIVVVWCIGW